MFYPDGDGLTGRDCIRLIANDRLVGDDLIRNKRATGRPKDLADVEVLERLIPLPDK